MTALFYSWAGTCSGVIEMKKSSLFYEFVNSVFLHFVILLAPSLHFLKTSF